MTGLLICTYNRPEYLRQCLDSIKRADLSRVDTVLIIDDKSTDTETLRLINDFELDGVQLIKAYSKENRSIKGSLLFGCDLLFNSCDVVTNLDGDAIVKHNFIDVLLKLNEAFPEHIKTGFNCLTKNKDGSERHKILGKGNECNWKASVGGLNMMFSKATYDKCVRPSLVECLKKGGNWDHKSCLRSIADGKCIISSEPSVVQHIGIDSSMGHSKGGEPPDVAEDFIYQPQGIIPTGKIGRYDISNNKLQLKNVTLICADGLDLNRVIHAADISCKNIEFGAVKILSNFPSDDPRVIKIRPLIDRKDYSQFVLKEMVNYVDTEFMLIFQYDGFVLNAKAWNDRFMLYDMVGAAWKFRPEKRTSNGGFSLRSKKMMEAIRDDDAIYLQNDAIINNYAEDHVLFYIYREYLEQKHGVNIAPELICDMFSIEAWGVKPPANKYNGSFGFHGFSVDFNDADLPYVPYRLPNRQIL